MTALQPPSLAADFYESSDGPSVLMEASSHDGVRHLLSALDRVAKAGVGAREELVGALMPTGTSVSSFELRNVAQDPTVQLRRIESDFVWEQTTDGWLATADLAAQLLDGPGHQYFADGPNSHAFIELSVGERHGLAPDAGSA